MTSAENAAALTPVEPKRDAEPISAIPTASSFSLQDVSYCGGAGVLANVCPKIEPSPKKGLLAVRDPVTSRFFQPTRSDRTSSIRICLVPDPLVPGSHGADARGRADRAVPDVHRRRSARRAGPRRRVPPASITSA